MTTATNLANIVKANWNWGFPNDGGLVEMKVVSTPNGLKYGDKGHIPCDHVLRCTYERAVKSFNGQAWSRVAR